MAACVKGQNFEFGKPAADDGEVDQPGLVIVQWNGRGWWEVGNRCPGRVCRCVAGPAGNAGLLPRLFRASVTVVERRVGMGSKLDPEVRGVPVERKIWPLAEVLELGRATVRVKGNSRRSVVKSS